MKINISWMLLSAYLVPAICLAVEEISEGSSQSSQITYKRISKHESSTGGYGNSASHNAVLENIISNKDGFLEVEYSFANDVKWIFDEWKLPARVSINSDSTLDLLNRSEIEARLQRLIESSPKVKRYCGENALARHSIMIDCDIDDVLDTLQTYNLHLGELADGSMYLEQGVLRAEPLARKDTSGSQAIFVVDLNMDPAHIREDYENNLRRSAAMTGNTFESILASDLNLSEGETPVYAGKRTVTISTDLSGNVQKIERSTLITINGGSQFIKTLTVNGVVERHAVE